MTDAPTDIVRRYRYDAERFQRDTLVGSDMLRKWLRSLHIDMVIGRERAQDMTQDEIAALLGEHPRGHVRFGKVTDAG